MIFLKPERKSLFIFLDNLQKFSGKRYSISYMQKIIFIVYYKIGCFVLGNIILFVRALFPFSMIFKNKSSFTFYTLKFY